VEKLQNAAGFGFDDRLYHLLPALIQDGDHNGFLVHVHSDIFDGVTDLSCLLGGKLIRVDACLSLKVKCHSPANLTRLSCSPFPPDTLLQLLSSAAVAERSPAQRNAAEAPPHPASTF
jgi:hypothetical protein